jgi:hypothetical protein
MTRVHVSGNKVITFLIINGALLLRSNYRRLHSIAFIVIGLQAIFEHMESPFPPYILTNEKHH